MRRVRKLTFLLVFLSLAISQAKAQSGACASPTVPWLYVTDSNNVPHVQACADPTTGIVTWLNGKLPTSDISALSYNKVCEADTQTGADAAAKINACIIGLPSTGGTVDARGLNGTETWGSTITISKPVVLLLGAATFVQTVNTGRMIYVPNSNVGPVSILGAGKYLSLFQCNSNDDCIVSRMGAGNSGTFDLEDLTVSDNYSGRTYGSGVVVSTGLGGASSTRSRLVNVQVLSGGPGLGFFNGLVVEGALNTYINHIDSFSQLDSFYFDGGTSTTVDTVFANTTAAYSRHAMRFTWYQANSQLVAPWSGLKATASTSSGTLGAGTYDFGIAAHDQSATEGGVTEIHYQDDATATLSSNGNIALSWPAVTYLGWRANFEYVLGQQIDGGNSHKYSAQGVGTSGTTQPSFPTTAGATVVDGGVTWKESGSSSFSYIIYSNNGLTGPLKQVAETAIGATAYTFSAPMTQTSFSHENQTGLKQNAGGDGFTVSNLTVDNTGGDTICIDSSFNLIAISNITLPTPTPFTGLGNALGKYGLGMRVGSGAHDITVINGFLAPPGNASHQDYLAQIDGGGNGSNIQFLNLTTSAETNTQGILNLTTTSSAPISVFGLVRYPPNNTLPVATGGSVMIAGMTAYIGGTPISTLVPSSVTNDVTSVLAGAITYRSDLVHLRYSDGSTSHSLVGADTTDTLSNKTLTGAVVPSVMRFKVSDQGQCTMASGACTAQSLASTYTIAPLCFANWTGTGTLAGTIKVASTTTTVTPSSSTSTDTAQVNWVCFGN